jgi:hypothetical protein
MGSDTFDVLALIGRPAWGKSRIIDTLMNTPPDARRRRFRIAGLEVMDDFPIVWSWLEDDRILSEKLGQPRVHTDDDGCLKHRHQWLLLNERLSLEYEKRLRDDPTCHDHTTLIVEFSRGRECNGYAEALPHLADDTLQRGAVLYVQVSFEESLRRNRGRFRPERPDDRLGHPVPEEALARQYRDDDWPKCCAGDPDYLNVRGIRVPYAVLDNEENVSAGQNEELAGRLETVFRRLWELQCSRR